MTHTGIKGVGRESGDAVGAAVFGVLTAGLDAVLVSRIWRWAGEQTAAEHRAAVLQTAALAGAVLFAALLGAAIAGRDSTPHRRWRYALLTALASHVLIPLALLAALAAHPARPTF
ncbi:hypothetical protein ABTY61_15955 [Kitasatospora sp. NPDC096128]|uniref:hypothetical protein n=1 Tax=Kitasatospora sp. NPDC096128 TaxID=3155547 RepID=UPI0033305896